MILNSPNEMCNHILASIRQKIGNVPIQLESTPNHKIRVTINHHRVERNFVNYREAMQWLIYTYNLKHLKNTIQQNPSGSIESFEERGGNKRRVIDGASKGIIDKIIENDFYSSEMFRKIVQEFDRLKIEKDLSDDEVRMVYNGVVNSLHRVMDETLDHRCHQIYKKYLDQLKIKGYRQY